MNQKFRIHIFSDKTTLRTGRVREKGLFFFAFDHDGEKNPFCIICITTLYVEQLQVPQFVVKDFFNIKKR